MNAGHVDARHVDLAPAPLPDTASPPGRTAPDMPADRAVKRRRLLDILDSAGRETLLLTSHTALTWYLDGSRVHISLSGDPVAAMLVPQRRPPGDLQQRGRQDGRRGAAGRCRAA